MQVVIAGGGHEATTWAAAMLGLVAVGGMCLIKKDVFNEVGGYDETNVTEDREIVYRIKEKGYKVRFAEEAKGYTEVPETLGKLYQQRKRWYYGEINTATKHKKFYFNRKFNTFGMFILPYSLFLQLISISIILRLADFIYHKYIVAYYYLIQEMIRQSYFIGFRFIWPHYLPSATFFWLIIFIFTIVLMLCGFHQSKFKLTPKYYFAFFVYIFFYNIYLGIIYLLALVQNLIGDFKWEKS